MTRLETHLGGIYDECYFGTNEIKPRHRNLNSDQSPGGIRPILNIKYCKGMSSHAGVCDAKRLTPVPASDRW